MIICDARFDELFEQPLRTLFYIIVEQNSR